mmetsp:Transcript_4085/g.7803  ORF Transcript_4085/g.7803 Transcript_4085/m.7803 type:complete len:175 (-) Transcript_4085:1450-1974(-)
MCLCLSVSGEGGEGQIAKIQAFAMQVFDDVNKKCEKLPYIPKAAESAGVKPGVIVLGAAGVLSLLLVAIIGFNAIVNMICFFWPAYLALKAMQEKEEGYDKQWLTYFMIFGFFHVLESFYPSLLTEHTFYTLIKLFVLFWCFLPQSKGAQKVYTLGIEKVLAMTGSAADSKKNE